VIVKSDLPDFIVPAATTCHSVRVIAGPSVGEAEADAADGEAVPAEDEGAAADGAADGATDGGPDTPLLGAAAGAPDTGGAYV
jgi:hypothetical protein